MPSMFTTAAPNYRFGFNGMLREVDIKDIITTPARAEGTGNSYDFGARIYDTRVGRFLSLDPLMNKFPWQSPYLFAGNDPIKSIDKEGANEQHFLVEKNSKDGTFKITCYADIKPPFGIQDLQDDIHYYWYNGNQYSFGTARLGFATGYYSQPEYEKAFRLNPDAMIEAGLLPNAPYDYATEAVTSNINPSHTDYIELGIEMGLNYSAARIISSKLLAPNNPSTNTSIEESNYSNVNNPKNAGPGKSFTPAQRKAILEQNMKQNGGQLTSDKSGVKLDPPTKNLKGKKANMNQVEVDHKIPKSKGGTNHSSNAQVLSKKENLKKYNKTD